MVVLALGVEAIACLLALAWRTRLRSWAPGIHQVASAVGVTYFFTEDVWKAVRLRANVRAYPMRRLQSR